MVPFSNLAIFAEVISRPVIDELTPVKDALKPVSDRLRPVAETLVPVAEILRIVAENTFNARSAKLLQIDFESFEIVFRLDGVRSFTPAGAR